MEKPPFITQPEQKISRIPLWLTVGANLANFLLSIQFYFIPSGAHIRPMAWAFWLFCIAVGGFVGLPLVLPAIRRGQQRFWPWLTVILALTPFPLAFAMLHHAARVRGFLLAPWAAGLTTGLRPNVWPQFVTDSKQHAKAKAEEFTRQVTSDPRWQLEDEMMCQVFGFTLHGYLVGIGRIHCFMDVEDIHALIVDQLAGLGIGRKYAEGLVQAAYQEFTTENNQSWQNRLNGVGHSHALKEDMKVLVDSIFINTAALKKATAGAAAARPWWKFWS